METKVCSKCGRELPATTEYFNKYKNRGKYLLRTKCKECLKQYNKENYEHHRKDYYKQYYEDNKEIKLKQAAEWKTNNKERISETNKRYYEENRDARLKFQKQCYIKNKDKKSEYSKHYRIDNIDKLLKREETYRKENRKEIRQRQETWRKNNLDKRRMSVNKYRAKRRELPNTLTEAEWDTAIEIFENKCAYCGGTHKLTQDHFIPQSKGGGYTKENIVPVCGNCNSKKLAKDFFEWYPQQDFYSKERETAILEFLGIAKEEAI